MCSQINFVMHFNRTTVDLAVQKADQVLYRSSCSLPGSVITSSENTRSAHIVPRQGHSDGLGTPELIKT